MTPCSLSQTIRKRAQEGHSPILLLESNWSPLLSLVDQIYYCPLSWRKFMLDACRIQCPVFQNRTLLKSFTNLSPTYIPHPSSSTSAVLVKDDFIPFLDIATSSSVTSSFLSYFLRSESTIYRDEFLQEKSKSLDKELAAALQPPDYEVGVLDYSALIGGVGTANLHAELGYSLPSRLSTLFTNGIRNIKNTLSTYTTLPLLPAYNARKNIAYESQENYWSLQGEPPSSNDVTTLDLLRLYAQTGDTVTGPLEMRQAWRYGDLKPRTYYCVGGTAYFDSLYIQDIANMLAKILPSTNPSTRFDISRLNPISPHCVVITYDYTSFTTSLEELQSFMFWLGVSLVGTPVEILDVRTGIRTLDLGEYILAYNASVNVNQVFTVERLDALLGQYRQGRSGSLGVKGNIVFSMLLHGVSLSSITGIPDHESCVGDDALTAILENTIKMFIICVNNLGSIAEEKFEIIPPVTIDDPTIMTLNQFKYLKRPLRRTATNEVTLGILDFFPSIAQILNPNDGIHTSNPASKFETVTTFVMQLGRFLNLQTQELSAVCGEEDLDFLIGCMNVMYDILHLPVDGAVPGEVSIEGKELQLFVPPVDRDVFSVHWMELLLIRHRGAVYTRPIFLDGEVAPAFDSVDGERFRATMSPFLRLLKDFSCVEIEILVEDVIFDDEALDWELTRMLHLVDERLYMYVDVVCLNLPNWYFEYAVRYASELNTRDPEDALSVVTSIIGN